MPMTSQHIRNADNTVKVPSGGIEWKLPNPTKKIPTSMKVGGVVFLGLGSLLVSSTLLANSGKVNFGFVEAIQSMEPAGAKSAIEHVGTQLAIVLVAAAVVALVAAVMAEMVERREKI